MTRQNGSPRPAGVTLGQVQATAEAYWATRRGGAIMGHKLERCMGHLRERGVASSANALVASPGSIPALLLKDLALGGKSGRQRGLSPTAVVDYYSAFKRALRLSGLEPVGWMSPPRPPRVAKREPISDADFEQVVTRLRGRGAHETADLAILLRHTGLRVGIEGLSSTSLNYSGGGPDDPYGTLLVLGKGGHERRIPVVAPQARALLQDPRRMDHLRAVPYRTHLNRWKVACGLAGVTSKLATLHAIRHRYATDALQMSGGDLRMVQDLLGHASPATTARYTQPDLSRAAAMLASGRGTSTQETDT